jgi:uncharacterized protein YeaO (DUF488 family)
MISSRRPTRSPSTCSSPLADDGVIGPLAKRSLLHQDSVTNMAKPSLKRSTTRTQMRKANSAEVPSIDLMIKRVYELPSDGDGYRVLIDRLWPRGLSKAKAAVDLWLRDIAPSAALRTWFNHDPARWTEFRRRYAAELDRIPAMVDQLLDQARQGRVTLLYSAQPGTCNNAVALSEYLHKKLSL